MILNTYLDWNKAILTLLIKFELISANVTPLYAFIFNALSIDISKKNIKLHSNLASQRATSRVNFCVV